MICWNNIYTISFNFVLQSIYFRSLHLLELGINLIELLTTRKQLLDSLYETDVLSSLYKSQARNFRQELNKIVGEPLKLDEISHSILGGNSTTTGIELFSSGLAYSELAVYSFDKSIAKFEFRTPQGNIFHSNKDIQILTHLLYLPFSFIFNKGWNNWWELKESSNSEEPCNAN